MESKLPEIEMRECPVCHKHIDIFEMYCKCGYEFGVIVVLIQIAEKHVEISQASSLIVEVKLKIILMGILVDYRQMCHRMGGIMSDKVKMDEVECLKDRLIASENIAAVNRPVDIILSLVGFASPAAEGIKVLKDVVVNKFILFKMRSVINFAMLF